MAPENPQAAARDTSEQPFGGPFADIHRHGESNAWLDSLLAERDGRPPYDWIAWRNSLAGIQPGPGRIAALVGPMENDTRDALLDQPEWSRLVLAACLGYAAASGAWLVEIRVGWKAAVSPGFLDRFREAESAVRKRHSRFVAEPILSGVWPARPGAQEALEACLARGPEGFAGVDFIAAPYEAHHDWDEAHRWAARFAEAGFGVTVHAGEFTALHLAPALETPGISRIGHGIALEQDPRLFNDLVDRRLVVECCLSSNLILGAVTTLDDHPIRQFVRDGARVAICTDNPARLGTTIRAEYELALRLGLSIGELQKCTAVAIEASFTSPEKKQQLAKQIPVG